MSDYRLAIEHAACWGCRSCEVACKQENRAPVGVRLIAVAEQRPEPSLERPDTSFRVNLCRHCDPPPCAEVCPVGAITRRDDGLVVMDTEECTGCTLCLEACPYGAIAFDEQEDKAYKCNLCAHRVDQGLIPACADNICLAHCITFGPADRLEEMVADRALLQKRLAADPRR
jgi:Fe-S-cluster-containing dehydrogenase component